MSEKQIDPATSNNSGGGVFLLLIVLGMLCYRPPELVLYRMTKQAGMPTHYNNTTIKYEVDRIADSYGIRRPLFHALVRVESGYNPKAVSSVGARGVAQIMPFNAKRCGLRNPDMLWDVVENLKCGAQILSEEIEQHGNVHSALVVYNCGKVQCKEGQQYANKVLALSKKFS